MPARMQKSCPGTRKRPHAGEPLRADRAGLLDGLRDPEAPELRARRPVHGRCVRRLLRDPVVRRLHRARDPGAAAAAVHVPARRRRRRNARCRDRALRLPAAARCAADRAADHRARRLVPAREQHAAAVRRLVPRLQHVGVHPVLVRHPHRRAEHQPHPDPRDRAEPGPDDRAAACSSTAPSSAGRCAPSRRTARRPRCSGSTSTTRSR